MAKDRKIDYVILGLLSHESLSGYDIKKRIDSGISFFWKGSFGSIYPALTALEESGFVKKKTDSKSSANREKYIYSITRQGRKHLKSWLEESTASNDLKYESLLKVIFGGNAKPEITIATIQRFEEETKENLAILKMYQATLKESLDNYDHIYYYLTVSFGVKTYEGYLKWCKEAYAMLNEAG